MEYVGIDISQQYVVNLLSVRRFAQSQRRRSKTDRTDAQLLSQFGRAFAPPLHQPAAIWLSQLQQRQALLDLFVASARPCAIIATPCANRPTLTR